MADEIDNLPDDAGLVPQRGPISAMSARRASGISGNFEFIGGPALNRTVSNENAGKLDLGKLFDGVADAFAADTASLHPAKGIVIEPKPGSFVDP